MSLDLRSGDRVPSTTQFAEDFARDVGANSTDTRVRVRLEREAGLLPDRGRKSDTPQIEAVHAVVVLLGHMAGGPQVDVVRRIKALWSLPFFHYQTIKLASPFLALSTARTPEPSHPAPQFCNLTFGATLTAIVDGAARGGVPPREITSAFTQIEVSHDVRFATILDPHD